MTLLVFPCKFEVNWHYIETTTFPKMWSTSIHPYHKVLKIVKKTNAQHLFFINNNFIFFFVFWRFNILPCVCNAKDFPTKVDDIITF